MPGDTTDSSILWNPGEPTGRDIFGNSVALPTSKNISIDYDVTSTEGLVDPPDNGILLASLKAGTLITVSYTEIAPMKGTDDDTPQIYFAIGTTSAAATMIMTDGKITSSGGGSVRQMREPAESTGYVTQGGSLGMSVIENCNLYVALYTAENDGVLTGGPFRVAITTI